MIAGDIIRIAREEAVDDHRKEKGESNWSLGCRQHERTNFAIGMARQQYPWLMVVAGFGTGPQEFVFAISGHPIRVCKGEHDEIPPRFQEPCFPELQQQQLLAALEQVPVEKRILRVVVENDGEGAPDDIYLVEVDEDTGEPLRWFLIPPLANTGLVAPFLKQVPPVNIPRVVAEAVDDIASSAEDTTATGREKKTGSDGE
jgi:hypothetical protein